MSQPIRKILANVIFNVLETMFFVIPERGEEEALIPWEMEGVIRITGGKDVTVRLLLPLSLSVQLASNFLGLEPEEVGENQLLDLVRELTNMVGGNLLTSMENGDLSLSLPEGLFRRDSSWAEDPADQGFTVRVDDHLLGVVWKEALA